jgi:hypothetical protein
VGVTVIGRSSYATCPSSTRSASFATTDGSTLAGLVGERPAGSRIMRA